MSKTNYVEDHKESNKYQRMNNKHIIFFTYKSIKSEINVRQIIKCDFRNLKEMPLNNFKKLMKK